MARLVLLVVSIISATVVTETRRLSNSISHYEPLDYNQRDLHEKHDRARRSADGELELQFNALERDFHLRLRRATSIFAEDFTIETSEDGVSDFDTSHIYTGFLQGEPSSHCHGSIHNGTFEGSIRSGSDEYFIEPAHRYYKEHHPDFHSVIYMGKDVQLTSEHRDPSGCSMSAELFTKMQKIQNDFQDKKKYIKDRTRRNSDQTTCPLFIQTDHTFYEKYGSYKEVVSAIASALDAVNYIYGNTVFGSYTNIGFLVKRIRVYTTSDIALPQYNFANEYIGVEKYLDLASSDNFDEYCLSYAFCARDFTNGILGLAWIGYASDLQGGGICDQYREYINQGWRSLNTGVVTTVNYGFPVPPLLFHLTFAHELGHSFGSPHDYPSECRPGGVAGNYIMYSKSSDGLHVNNNEFSECSIGNMTLVLDAKKNRCFTSPDFAICGNGIVEGTEECDCGYEYECEDKCCEPRKAAVSDSNACKLSKYIPGVECSLSDGPCCDPDTCRPMAIGEVCRLAGDCHNEMYCNGTSALCPSITSDQKDDGIKCDNGRRVCKSGLCTGSLCETLNLEECTCERSEEYCDLCCRNIGLQHTCVSASKWLNVLDDDNEPIFVHPGTACNSMQGYCDEYHVCRDADEDGPLINIVRKIFKPSQTGDILDDVRAYIKNNWWVVLVGMLGLIVFMLLTVIVCTRICPTDNPEKKNGRNKNPVSLRKKRYRQSQMPGHHPIDSDQHPDRAEERATRM